MSPPDIPDTPRPPRPDQPVQPVEPALPPGQTDLVSIPTGPLGIGPAGAVELSQLDQVPIPKYQAKPVYPVELKRSHSEGMVLVDFIVDAEGNVRNAAAAHSSNRGFEESAVAAVSRWKFKPGRKDGHAVATHMQVPIVFSLTAGD